LRHCRKIGIFQIGPDIDKPGGLICLSVIRSPINIANPPSPDREMICRPGCAACAPIACGKALAIDPWTSDPISLRRPFILR